MCRFLFLPAHKEDLGISSFGVSVTTMEEVFIRVGEGMDETLETRLRRKKIESEGVNVAMRNSRWCAPALRREKIRGKIDIDSRKTC